MDIKFFFNGIKNIFLDPAKVWELTGSENITVKPVRNKHLIPLLLIASVSSFFGSFIFTNSEQSAVYSVFVAIECFVSLYFATYLSALILKEITYPLDLGRDFNNSFRIIAYSITPFLICQILSNLFESLLFVNVIAFYGFYIFWVASEKLLNAPHYKKMPLLIATAIITIGIFIATSLLFTKLMDKAYFAFFA